MNSRRIAALALRRIVAPRGLKARVSLARKPAFLYVPIKQKVRLPKMFALQGRARDRLTTEIRLLTEISQGAAYRLQTYAKLSRRNAG